MDRRHFAPLVILLVVAYVLAVARTWHEVREAKPASAQAGPTTTLDQVPTITTSPSKAPSSGTATSDAWKTYTVQTWKWAYQIQIPKGWYAIDYTNENAADSGMQSGEPRMGFASFSPASASGRFPEITVVVAVGDGGKQYNDATGKVIKVGGAPAKMSTGRQGYPASVYVLHGNETYEFALHTPSAQETFDHVLQTVVFLPLARSFIYRNTQYGFSLSMPLSWRGFTTQVHKLQMCATEGSNGHVQYASEITFRNPDWRADNRYEDIPIMVFTPTQWKLVSGDDPKCSVSAAPFGPGELGRNSKYVFAVPPRWNYDFSNLYGEAGVILGTFKAF
jgi:hypothetical protein